MSSKKSKKFMNIMLTALMLLAGGSVESYAEYGVNGVTYVLMPNETTSAGVWRLNKKDGSNANPWKLFLIEELSKKGKVSGLAANQENKVFFLLLTKKTKYFCSQRIINQTKILYLQVTNLVRQV